MSNVFNRFNRARKTVSNLYLHLKNLDFYSFTEKLEDTETFITNVTCKIFIQYSKSLFRFHSSITLEKNVSVLLTKLLVKIFIIIQRNPF